MKEAKVSTLKAHLSAYLHDVRHGETVVVLDRNTPIARLVPYEEKYGLQLAEASRRATQLRQLKPIRLRKKVDLHQLLREDRDQR